MQKEIKIFLASSEELKQDRESFGNLIRQLDVDFEQKSGLRIRLLMWEDLDPAYNCVRKQEEYNTKVRECDVFVALFYKKAGKFTREEFDVAAQKREKEGKPIIYVYTRELAEGDELSEDLNLFMNELHNVKEHFACTYINSDMLKLQFRGLIYAQYGVIAPELRIKNSKIYQDNTYVASMNQLPCVVNNERMSTLKEELSKVEKAILKFESILELDDENGTFANVLKQHQKQREDLIVDIENHERMLLSTVVSIFDKQLEESSSRYKLAVKEFNAGNVTNIKKILNKETIVLDYNLALKEINKGTNILKSLLGELELLAQSILLDENNENRKVEAIDIYQDCLDLINKNDFIKIETKDIMNLRFSMRIESLSSNNVDNFTVNESHIYWDNKYVAALNNLPFYSCSKDILRLNSCIQKLNYKIKRLKGYLSKEWDEDVNSLLIDELIRREKEVEELNVTSLCLLRVFYNFESLALVGTKHHWFSEAVKLFEKGDTSRASGLLTLIQGENDLGEYDEIQRKCAISKELLLKNIERLQLDAHSKITDIRNNNRVKDAYICYDQALKMAKQLEDKDYMRVVLEYALFCYKYEQYKNAINYFNIALEYNIKHLGLEHPDTKQLQNLIKQYESEHINN